MKAQIKFQSDLVPLKAQATRMRDLFIGVKRLREKKEVYLPMTTGELRAVNSDFYKSANMAGKDPYSIRVKTSALKDFYAKTIRFILGQLYKRAPVLRNVTDLKQEVADYYTEFENDVNRRGDNLRVFCSDVTKAALIDGVTFVMIDSPRFIRSNGKIVYNDTEYPDNMETQKSLNLYPYLTHIELNRVIAIRTSDTSVEHPIEFFSFYEINGDGEHEEVRVYEYTPVSITIRKFVDGNELEGEKTVVLNTYGFVPVYVLGIGEREKDYIYNSPMNDLGEQNLSYYEKSSHHNTLMMWQRNPTWFAKNIDINENQTIGVSMIITTTAENADLKNVGVDATSAQQSLADLKQIEDWCVAYYQSIANGASMTATQAEGIVGAAISPLTEYASTVEDFMNMVMWDYNVLCFGYDTEESKVAPEYTVNQDFLTPFSLEKANFLKELAMDGQISSAQFLKEMKRMSLFGDDFDIDAELKLQQTATPQGDGVVE